MPGPPAITINNIQSASVAAGNSIAINNYVIESTVQNRMLVCVVAGEDDPYDMTGISATFGGNAMTEYASGFVTVGTTIRAYADIFYMINPPAGTTDDLAVTLAATATVLSGSAWLFYLGNAKQQAPTNTTSNTSTSSPMTTNITPTPTYGMIIDVIVCGNVSNFTATGTNHSIGATEIDQSSSTVAWGKLPFSSAAQMTPSWTNSSVNRMAQAVAVFERE